MKQEPSIVKPIIVKMHNLISTNISVYLLTTKPHRSHRPISRVDNNSIFNYMVSPNRSIPKNPREKKIIHNYHWFPPDFSNFSQKYRWRKRIPERKSFTIITDFFPYISNFSPKWFNKKTIPERKSFTIITDFSNFSAKNPWKKRILEWKSFTIITDSPHWFFQLFSAINPQNKSTKSNKSTK